MRVEYCLRSVLKRFNNEFIIVAGKLFSEKTKKIAFLSCGFNKNGFYQVLYLLKKLGGKKKLYLCKEIFKFKYCVINELGKSLGKVRKKLIQNAWKSK